MTELGTVNCRTNLRGGYKTNRKKKKKENKRSSNFTLKYPRADRGFYKRTTLIDLFPGLDLKYTIITLTK